MVHKKAVQYQTFTRQETLKPRESFRKIREDVWAVLVRCGCIFEDPSSYDGTYTESLEYPPRRPIWVTFPDGTHKVFHHLTYTLDFFLWQLPDGTIVQYQHNPPMYSGELCLTRTDIREAHRLFV